MKYKIFAETSGATIILTFTRSEWKECEPKLKEVGKLEAKLRGDEDDEPTLEQVVGLLFGEALDDTLQNKKKEVAQRLARLAQIMASGDIEAARPDLN